MMTPNDFIKILTAVTPFVATLTPLIRGSENKEQRKDNPEPVNVTINNNFYVNSKEDAVEAAKQVSHQVVEQLPLSKTRYML